MKAFFARIGAILRAVAKATTKTARFALRLVVVAGRMIWWLVPQSTAAEEIAAIEETVEAMPERDEHLVYVRSVAACLSQGQTPHADYIGQLSDKEFKWLAAMDRQQLRAVIAADDRALTDHIRGRTPIRGVLVSDAVTAERLSRQEQHNWAAEPTEACPGLSFAPSR